MRTQYIAAMLCVTLVNCSEAAAAQSARCSGPVVSAQGRFTEIFIPGAMMMMPSGINARGDVVGYLRFNYDAGHGFLADRKGTVTILDYPGSGATFPADINNSGVVVGHYRNQGESAQRLYLYRKGQWQTPETPVLGTVPSAINNAGDIVGILYPQPPQFGFPTESFLLSRTGAFEVLMFPGADVTRALDITNGGAILGQAHLPGAPASEFFSFIRTKHGDYHVVEPCQPGLQPSILVGGRRHFAGTTPDGFGFIETAGGVALIDIPDGQMPTMTDVNSSGQAIGFYIASGYHGFVFSPE